MTSTSLLSVQVPSLNCARTLTACLHSILSQGETSTGVVVIDGGSTDGTPEVARNAGASVLECRQGLLASRVMAILGSSAQGIVLVDADHVMTPGSLARIGLGLQSHDMLVLGESSDTPRTFLQRLYAADRWVGQSSLASLDPMTSPAMPRAFRGELIRLAAGRIPLDQLRGVRYPDHAILHYECSLLAGSTGYVPDALVHQENDDWRELLEKHYIYGRDAAQVRRCPRYRGLIAGKASSRPIPASGVGLPRWVMSELLLAIKSLGYTAGLVAGPRRYDT